MYIFFKTLAYCILKIFFRFSIEGRENIPRAGAFILASNHISYFDPAVVGCAVPVDIFYLAKEELFRNRFFGWFLKRLHSVPLRRGKTDIVAMKTALALLKEQKPLLVFPQGGRTSDWNRVFPGTGFLYKKTKVPVVLARVSGTDQVLPRGARFPRFSKITVKYSLFTPQDSNRKARDIAADILSAIRRM